jgi:putative transposase
VERYRLVDEVFLTINGKLQYLSGAVDQDGDVLDILVQPRQNKKAAKKFFRKLLKGLQYVPRAIVTDKAAQLRSSQGRSHAFSRASAARQAEQSGRKLLSAYSRNRARMRGSKSHGHAHRFHSIAG